MNEADDLRTKNQVQVEEVGVGRTGDDQVAAALEKGMSVVVVEPLTRVLPAATERTAVDESAGGVGGSVGAVGPRGEDDKVIGRVELERGRQGQLLTPPPTPAATNGDGRLAP